MKEKICIVIPVYNAQKLLPKTVMSVKRQSFGEWRLILVDDGSKDGSSRVCDELAASDERITVIHTENQGSCEARKTGIRNCTPGTYVTFLDADDLLPKDALKTLFELAISTGADLVSGRIVRFIGKKLKLRFGLGDTKPGIIKEYTNEQIINELYISYFGITDYSPALYSKLYKYELIVKMLDIPRYVKFFGEDINFTIRLLPLVQKLVTTSDIVYEYRTGGITSKFMDYYFDDCLAIFDMQQELIQQYPMPLDAHYYTCVQLKNELYEYFLMCMEKGGFSKEKLMAEIEKLCCNPVVEAALRHPRGDTSGRDGFRELAAEKKYNEIYALLESHPPQPLKVRLVKKIASII